MTNFFTVTLFLAVAVVGAPARAAVDAAAPSAGAPLLVVVETGPGAGCDADAVRAAIAAELHTAVVAPSSSPVVALAGPRAHTLLVSIDRERIFVTLPGRAGEDLTRSVAAPVERAARLRAVAWLAGNLARDQLASLPLPEVSPSPSVEPPATPPPTPPEATPAVVATAPPALPTNVRGPTSIARAASGAPTLAYPRWTLSASVGTVAMFDSLPSNSSSWNLGGQLEVHGHRGPWFAGAAIDLGPGNTHPFGGALLFGGQRPLGDLRLEASAGLGVEEFIFHVFPPTPSSNVFLATDYAQRTAAAYARAALSASYPLARDLDLLAQLTGHLTATSHANPAFVAATLGLRVRLP